MKNNPAPMLIFLCMLILAACGKNNNENSLPNEADTKEEEQMEEEQVESENDEVKEIFQMVEEANGNLHSFSTDIHSKQEVNMNGEKQINEARTNMDFIADPLAIKQRITMTMSGQEKQETETYVTNDGYYMHDPRQGGWITLSDEMTDQMLAQTGAYTLMESQLEDFEQVIDDLSLEEEEDLYLLSFKAEEDAINEPMKDLVKRAMPESMTYSQEGPTNHLDVHFIEYEMTIYKDTHYLHTLQIRFDFSMQIEGEMIQSSQDMQATYSNFNEIEKIVIPDQALEQAREIEG